MDRHSNIKIKRGWTKLKPNLLMALQTTEAALDGLPIPGAKACIRLVLHFMTLSDVASGNLEALEALQTRFENLLKVLSPLYAGGNDNPSLSDSFRVDIGNLAKTLDALATQWQPRIEARRRKWDIFRRMLHAEDDHNTLNKFAIAVDRTIQDFIAITITHWRIEDLKEASKNREAAISNKLHQMPRSIAASYNSVRTGGSSICLQGTRIRILAIIRNWAQSPDIAQTPIFWLNGLAGIGKSTIAHTIATYLDKEGFLGASFVFLRTDDQLNDARLVIPTLAFQLAQFNPEFRARVAEALELDPDCGSKSLEIQFEKLIHGPLCTISLSKPVIIILDALDECEPQELTSKLLQIMLQNVANIPYLRIFITSRPEGYIREALDLVPTTPAHRKLVLHEDVHTDEVDNDIRLFLALSLQEIWDKHTKQTGISWPSDSALEELVKRSGKLFVYAATAVRFVGGNRGLNPGRQLAALLRIDIGDVPHAAPYRQLDGLYLRILEHTVADAEDYYVKRFRDIVGSIALLEKALPMSALAALLGGYSVEEIEETLYHLHSIIIVPENSTEAPRVYHLSFSNFITNVDRCTNPRAYVDPQLQHKFLFLRCCAIMAGNYAPTTNTAEAGKSEPPAGNNKRQLRVVVASEATEQPAPWLESPFYFGSLSSIFSSWASEAQWANETDEDELADPALPTEIWYSNKHWCSHLMKAPISDGEVASALERLTVYYLDGWVKRHMIGIVKNGRVGHTLTNELFDALHNAYRWGIRAGCSSQFEESLRRIATAAFGELFPDADYYVLGEPVDWYAITGVLWLHHKAGT